MHPPCAGVLAGTERRSLRRLASGAGSLVQVRRPPAAGGTTGPSDVPAWTGRAGRRRCRGAGPAPSIPPFQARIQSGRRSCARNRIARVAPAAAQKARAAAGESRGATASDESEARLRVEPALRFARLDAPLFHKHHRRSDRRCDDDGRDAGCVRSDAPG